MIFGVLPNSGIWCIAKQWYFGVLPNSGFRVIKGVQKWWFSGHKRCPKVVVLVILPQNQWFCGGFGHFASKSVVFGGPKVVKKQWFSEVQKSSKKQWFSRVNYHENQWFSRVNYHENSGFLRGFESKTVVFGVLRSKTVVFGFLGF